MVISYLKGNENTIINKRKVPQRLLKRAIVVMFVSVFIIIVSLVFGVIAYIVSAFFITPLYESTSSL